MTDAAGWLEAFFARVLMDGLVGGVGEKREKVSEKDE